MEIKVSVIMPVYNAAKYLKHCLNTVLGQSLKEIEVICVDDGSTDESPMILMDYAALDTRLHIITQSNSGPGIARNVGLKQARGKYVVFLDSDDWFELDFLESMFDCITRNKADICICRAEQFDSESGRGLPSEWMLKTELLPGECFTPEKISEHLFQFTYGQVWDKLYRRAFLLENSLVFPDMRAAEDTSFVYQGLLLADRICVLPEVKVHYRVNVNGSVSSSFVKHPEAPFKAFELVYEFFLAKCLYEKYERSFLNWAMEYLVWQVCNMPDEGIRRNYYTQLFDKWDKILPLSKYAISSDNKSFWLKYAVLKFFPYSLVNFGLKKYKMF